MANRGGARPGAGRKALAEELNTRELAMKAITNKFGTKEAALEWLMDSKEPSLIKFAFEHAFGKPVDEVKGNITSQITVRIVRGKSNSE